MSFSQQLFLNFTTLNLLMHYVIIYFKHKILINLYMFILKMFISRYKFKKFTLINQIYKMMLNRENLN